MSFANGQTLAPPSGWAWQNRPWREDSLPPLHVTGSSAARLEYWAPGILVMEATDPNVQQVGSYMTALYRWALDNCIAIEPGNFKNFTDTANTQILAALHPGATRARYSNLVYATPVDTERYSTSSTAMAGGEYHVLRRFFAKVPAHRVCGGCNQEISLIDGSIRHACGRYIACIKCGITTTLFSVEGNWYCATHIRRCTFQGLPRCQTYTPRVFHFCVQHGNRVNCAGCQTSIEIPAGTETAPAHCARCIVRLCGECGELQPETANLREIVALSINVCEKCWRRVFRDAGDLTSEHFDEGATLSAESLMLNSHPHRPVRICSIELETTIGGSRLAQNLHEASLAPSTGVHAYHHAPTRDSFCWVEADSTLGAGGGELILNRLEFDNKDDMNKLKQSLDIVRRLVRENSLGITTRCGLHIHVDAHKFGIGHVRNLVMVFNYLEDPLYRMAAAKYFRHRGLRHAAKIGKGPFNDKEDFSMSFLPNNGHTHGLNVGHYWSAMRNGCQCGSAITGAHEKCKCKLQKCTFEFRIFNGTANPKKIHAYTALAQSLVGYAKAMPDIDVNDFPPLEYNATAQATPQLKEAWLQRLQWMFRNLYFSSTEKEHLLYVIRNSQLQALGEDVIESLRTIPYTAPRGAVEIPIEKIPLRVSRADDPAFIDEGIENPFISFDHDGLTYEDEEPY